MQNPGPMSNQGEQDIENTTKVLVLSQAHRNVGQIPMLSGEIPTTLYILCITNVMQLYVYIHCCYIMLYLYLYSLSISVNPSLYLIYLQYLSRLFSPVLLFLSLFSSFLFSYLMVSYLNYWVFPYPSIRCSLQVSSNNLIISYPPYLVPSCPMLSP